MNILRGGHLSNLVYKLELDIPYKLQEKWDQTPSAQILEEFPELDFHRLQDTNFSATPEGQKLAIAYTELCGDILSNQNERGTDRHITNDGRELPRPQVPLSQHPIIEALVAGEVAVDRPKPKYSFGPSDLTDVILDSDSQPAHAALVKAINTRLPEGQRYAFDGPNEFQHKQRNIWSILHAYKEAHLDNQRRGLLRNDLVTILEAYTTDGEIATSIRQENDKRQAERSWREGDISEVHQVKEIVGDIIKVGMAAPDLEITARVEALISQYLSNNGRELVNTQDVLVLTRADLMLVVIDAIKEVTNASHSDVFERIGTIVFGSETIGMQLRAFAEQGIQAYEIHNSPEVLKAQLGLRKFDLSFERDKNPEEVRARRALDELVRPANQLLEGQRRTKNQLLFNLLGQFVQSGALRSQNRDAAWFFKGLVQRIDFKDYKMSKLPEEYHSLIVLGNNPDVLIPQKNNILWHMHEQFEYVESEAAYLLIPVIMDMYQVALGPVDAIRLPEKETSHGLSAASAIVRKHGHGMFKAASQDQLQTLARYAMGIRDHAERIATGALLNDGESDIDMSNLQDWQKETIGHLRNVMRDLKEVEAHYEQYLHIEEVKVFPHVYYPWLLQQLTPFWQKMQWEVGPGNRPSFDIRGLYDALENHIRNRLVIRKPEGYPEDFDILEEGHLDTLLLECYNRMVVPHDIKYNTTVWQEGLTFMLRAVSHMPPSVMEGIKAKYPNSEFANYLEAEYKRWNETEDIH